MITSAQSNILKSMCLSAAARGNKQKARRIFNAIYSNSEYVDFTEYKHDEIAATSLFIDSSTEQQDGKTTI